MDEPNDRKPTRQHRRTFIRRGAVGLLGLGVLRQGDGEDSGEEDGENGGANGGEDGEGETQIRRRFLLERVAGFEQDEPTDDYVGRGLLVTTKTGVQGQPEGEFDCGFPDWNPESFVKYQVLLFDVNQGVITESRAYIAEASEPIPTGTPYLINVQTPCSGRYVGVEGEQVPGRLVE